MLVVAQAGLGRVEGEIPIQAPGPKDVEVGGLPPKAS